MGHQQASPQFDAIIVGGGLAGQVAALQLADARRVALICKRPLDESASAWAQGGIAAVLDPEDSLDAHVEDTLVAGAGLSNETTTRFIVERAPAAIQWLVQMGVPFSRGTEGQPLHLTREGGHSRRRIVHAADATGAAVQSTLSRHLRSHPNITVFEQHIAIDLITAKKLGADSDRCLGLYALDKESGQVLTFSANDVVLATGGAGKVYLYTTNPDSATGDGVAMGWRAGCRVANMEFIQFHPTCLYHPEAKSFLISEALRGEGGILRLPDGQAFMAAHDPRAELAPRDVVARAIDFEMKRLGIDCVFLDMTHKPRDFLLSHFPNILARCAALGIDIATQPIPVVPAAHYTCGGVVTDLAGRTDIPHLYAIGEVACTGLHGANRLASNSLLECLVFGFASANAILGDNEPAAIEALPLWDESRVTDADEEVVISHNWAELRRCMWDYVGIVRTDKRLARALHRIDLLTDEIADYYANFRVTNDLIELRNLVTTARLIVQSAQARKESRGLHFSRDYPRTFVSGRETILTP